LQKAAKRAQSPDTAVTLGARGTRIQNLSREMHTSPTGWRFYVYVCVCVCAMKIDAATQDRVS